MEHVIEFSDDAEVNCYCYHDDNYTCDAVLQETRNQIRIFYYVEFSCYKLLIDLSMHDMNSWWVVNVMGHQTAAKWGALI